MQQTEISYLDDVFTITEDEPSTLAEVVELLGDDAVRQLAVDNVRYRNKHPRVYKAVSAAVEPSFPREIKSSTTAADGTVKTTKVSTIDHLRAYLATGDEAKAVLAELFNTHANSQPLYVKGERSGGGGKIGKEAMDAANAIFAQGDDKVESVAAKIEGAVPGYKIGRDADGAATPESLARGISALQKHLAKQSLLSALS